MGFTPTEYHLGPVALDLATFSWPIYRGAVVRYIQIDQGGQRWDEIRSLPRVTNLRIICKGENDGRDEINIEGVRVVEKVHVSEKRCYVVIADVREELNRFIMDLDFNVLLKDGYLNETRAAKVIDALRKMKKKMPAFGKLYDGKPFRRLKDESLPDDILTSGKDLPGALDEVLEAHGVSVIAVQKGKLAFVDKRDVGQSDVPGVDDFEWLEGSEPVWQTLHRVRHGKGKKFLFRYWSRHTIRIQNEDASGQTVVTGSETAIELEQVYLKGRDFFIRSSLLRSFGLPGNLISDKEIAFNILTKNFEKSDIYRDGSKATDDLIAIFKRDWRKLWRIKNQDTLVGKDGVWDALVVGVLNSDGSGAVEEAAVRCEFTEIRNVVSSKTTGGRLVGTQLSTNFEKDAQGRLPEAPFRASFVGPFTDGIIKLEPASPEGYELWPGLLKEPIKIDWTQNQKPPGGGQAVGGVAFQIEASNREQGEFDPDFALQLFIVATRRAPNNDSRWWEEETDGFADADVPVQEFEVGPELTAYRDYVDPLDPARAPLADGFGPILNGVATRDDAKRRGQLYRDEVGRKLEGKAEALGVKAARTVKLEGAIKEMNIKVAGLYVGTEIEVGNIAAPEERARIAATRERGRKRRKSAKEIEA